jgi:hypothetical protein
MLMMLYGVELWFLKGRPDNRKSTLVLLMGVSVIDAKLPTIHCTILMEKVVYLSKYAVPSWVRRSMLFHVIELKLISIVPADVTTCSVPYKNAANEELIS